MLLLLLLLQALELLLQVFVLVLEPVELGQHTLARAGSLRAFVHREVREHPGQQSPAFLEISNM